MLNTGRCGSATFIKACGHISNYTTGHETRTRLLAPQHLEYPENHIEADNRLVWFLGNLDLLYGDNAFYVHLKRNPDEVAKSYARRTYVGGILRAYYDSIKMGASEKHFDKLSREELFLYAKDYVKNAEISINNFLKDKDKFETIDIDNPKENFINFWNMIGSEGNLQKGLLEFDIKYNKSIINNDSTTVQNSTVKLIKKCIRISKKLPEFISNA